ncbi:MAG: diguanylate cyclase [Candidatus Aminicenantes bacterium]|nr:diguanylate cyclase [Candidatus Aminicenantes bacterium]
MALNEKQNFLDTLSIDCLAEILATSFEGVFFLDKERNILFWNQAAETISGYTNSEVLGRKCSDRILAPIDDQGRALCSELCPLNDLKSEVLKRNLELYIHHRDGYRLPVIMRIRPLKNLKGEIIGTAHIFIDISPRVSMPPQAEELSRLDLIDPLTSVGNRTFLRIYLQSRLQEMQKFKLSFGVLYIDVDRLAEINDLHGRVAGDRLIAAIARTLQNNLRFIDVLGRWNDDEFMAIITHVDETKLDVVANKLRLLAQNSFILSNGLSVSTSVSIGATMARRRDTIKDIVDRAEKLMLHSKWLGRNRVSSRLTSI